MNLKFGLCLINFLPQRAAEQDNIYILSPIVLRGAQRTKGGLFHFFSATLCVSSALLCGKI